MGQQSGYCEERNNQQNNLQRKKKKVEEKRKKIKGRGNIGNRTGRLTTGKMEIPSHRARK